MPKRNDIHTILLIGSGPIVIGQACEFDYAGTQAVRALKEEGYRVVLVNSNPATIMTSPELADCTYIEPLTRESLLHIIRKEKPDALLPTMGGQTALNLAKELYENGDLETHKVKLIGASIDAINRAEDRAQFYELIESLNLKVPRSAVISSLDDIPAALKKLGLPIIVRSSFTLGGTGAGIAETEEDLYAMCQEAFHHSIQMEVELSESLLGFKEFELEVVRDCQDNTIIVCSIENIHPMGVHTGDSVTVSPQQTLTDREYQRMRTQAFEVIRAVGVDTGGANVQFAVNPKNGEQYVIEMNPRVSRSSALASKATGFPIAKIAAKLAVGFTLDELANDMTNGLTPASFEPALDYVVTKIPYFQFEKFLDRKFKLGTTMHAIGEVMAIGRTFTESFCKAFDSLEQKGLFKKQVEFDLDYRNPEMLIALIQALRSGVDPDALLSKSGIDPWFVYQLNRVFKKGQVDPLELFAKGLSREQMESCYDIKFTPIELLSYKHIDSCAAEFPVFTDYLYSCHEQECELERTEEKSILIIGSGPNRIGQGIEFDYSCVEALIAAKEMGYQTIMYNSNPETVSTDYDVADKLLFEPITTDYVLNAVKKTQPEQVIVQFGGQTPINLLGELVKAKVPLQQHLYRAIQLVEDRRLFNELLQELGLNYSPYEVVSTYEAAKAFVDKVGYPVLMRPSYVIGGKGMQRINEDQSLKHYFDGLEQSVQIEVYFENAIEFDVDAISDGRNVLVAGILEHVEPLGVHSGDSIQVIPPYSIDSMLQQVMLEATKKIAMALKIVGPFNIQMAYYRDKLYMIEVNPRCSRSLPFIAKSTGAPLARIAMRCLLGQSLIEQGYTAPILTSVDAVKVPIFVFNKFKDADILLGPEMKSTGEVMGLGLSTQDAASKAFKAAKWPQKIGSVLLNADEHRVPELVELLPEAHIETQDFSKIEQFDLVLDIKMDNLKLRREALKHNVCYINSIRVLNLLVAAINNKITALNSLQMWQEEVINYATCTNDQARGRSFTSGTRSLEESGAS